MIPQLRHFSFLLFLGLLAAHPLAAQEWSRFRGPNGSGISTATTVPVQWTEKDFAWKVALPGQGHSSPVLWGDKIFLTAGDKNGKRHVLCLSATDGSTLWAHTEDAKAYHLHNRNSYATATPAADAQHVYVSWATPDKYVVQAFDHDGKRAWEADLGLFPSQHGFGTSPIVFEDLVIAGDEHDGGGSLVALEAATGKVRWRIERHGKNATYSTPCVYEGRGKPQLIFTNWQHGITAVDPKTGTVDWELSVFETEKQERAIASPVIAGDLVLATCGFVTAQKHLVAVRPGEAKDGGKPREVWRLEQAVSYLPTPVVKDELLFQVSELGIASCLQVATGKVLWQERLNGNYSASPIWIDGRLYCVANDGQVTVLAATDKFQVLARNTLGETTQSTPAVANGRIYFRTASHLIALGGKK